MLRQKASFLQRRSLQRTDAGLNNVLSIPPAVSHFAAGWTAQQRNPSLVEAASQLAFRSHSLVLIHVIDMPPDVVKSPGMPLTPSSQLGPVFARLALLSAHIRTNLIWPEGAFCDWWFHHVSSATAIWSGSTAARMLVCGCAYVHNCLICDSE